LLIEKKKFSREKKKYLNDVKIFKKSKFLKMKPI